MVTTMIVIVVVGAVLMVLQGVVARQVDKTAQEVSDRTNKALKRAVNERVASLAVCAQLLADRPSTRAATFADDATMQDYLKSTLSMVNADWIGWVSDGRVHAIVGSAPLKTGLKVSGISDVDGAISSQKPWSGVTVVAGAPFLAAECPVTIAGYAKGYLLVGSNLDERMLKSIASINGVEIVAYVKQGQYAATLPISSVAKKGGSLQWMSVEGRDYVGAFSSILSRQGNVVVRFLALTPKSEVMGVFNPLSENIYVLLALSLGTALAIGYWFGYSVTRPIQRLLTSAQEIQAGRWPEPINSSRSDEIGYLQATFDKMCSLLREREDLLINVLDPLTGVQNHKAFKERLQTIVTTQTEHRKPLSLVFVDIDGFADYNAEKGSHAGDQLLVDVAGILGGFVPPDGCIGRFGGDVFAVAIPDVDDKGVAEEVRRALYDLTGHPVSVGFVAMGEGLATAELLIIAAEMAVSQAKSGGRNHVRVFEGFDSSAEESDLRRVLKGGGFAAVKALAEAVDAKDNYTKGHSQRVADYAKDLARVLGYDEGFVELVGVTGTLHDVGKIGVPDEILKKASALTDEEFEEIKKHPALGEKIVSQIPTLADTLPGIRHHHERYDGKGYPDGLSGQYIPLLGRILAVADAYDAMTSSRSYRKAMSPREALGRMKEALGTQFDPRLGKAFIDLMTSDEGVRAA